MPLPALNPGRTRPATHRAAALHAAVQAALSRRLEAAVAAAAASPPSAAARKARADALAAEATLIDADAAAACEHANVKARTCGRIFARWWLSARSRSFRVSADKRSLFAIPYSTRLFAVHAC